MKKKQHFTGNEVTKIKASRISEAILQNPIINQNLLKFGI